MSHQPVVSVIISNYNYERFVGEAIDSALSQTYPIVEIIVVDDGSTDDSRSVIESRGNRIRAIFEENGGQASAMNAGFARSTGDLVFFLDSDDLLEAEAIETVVREWREGLARARFPLRLMDGDGNDLGRLMGAAVVPSPVLGPFGVGSPTSGNCFARTALEKIMPIPEQEWKINADVYLLSAVLFGGEIYLAQPLAKYRVHGDNGSRQADAVSDARSRLNHHLKLHRALNRLTGGRIASLEKWLEASTEHWTLRIMSLRERPADHPWPDRLSGLILRAVKAAWRKPGRNFRRRLALVLFALGYGILPKRVTHFMRNVEGGSRGRGLTHLLGR